MQYYRQFYGVIGILGSVLVSSHADCGPPKISEAAYNSVNHLTPASSMNILDAQKPFALSPVQAEPKGQDLLTYINSGGGGDCAALKAIVGGDVPVALSIQHDMQPGQTISTARTNLLTVLQTAAGDNLVLAATNQTARLTGAPGTTLENSLNELSTMLVGPPNLTALIPDLRILLADFQDPNFPLAFIFSNIINLEGNLPGPTVYAKLQGAVAAVGAPTPAVPPNLGLDLTQVTNLLENGAPSVGQAITDVAVYAPAGPDVLTTLQSTSTLLGPTPSATSDILTQSNDIFTYLQSKGAISSTIWDAIVELLP